MAKKIERWVYRTMRASVNYASGHPDISLGAYTMDEMGERGWELVSATAISEHSLLMIFKKPFLEA